MNSLLVKIRKLNEILKLSATTPVSFTELTSQLSEILSSNIYIVENDGSILAYTMATAYNCDLNYHASKEERFPEDFSKKILGYTETISNVYESSPICTFGDKGPCIYKDRYLTIIPIVGIGKRLGTLVLAKYGDTFQDEEIILCEYAAAIVVMELLKHEQEQEKERLLEDGSVKMAVSTLSFSEMEAIKMILNDLENDEGLVIASNIANEAHITRSVISNALRKLESAGVIQTRSLGMKGTYIKLLAKSLKNSLR